MPGARHPQLVPEQHDLRGPVLRAAREGLDAIEKAVRMRWTTGKGSGGAQRAAASPTIPPRQPVPAQAKRAGTRLLAP